MFDHQSSRGRKNTRSRTLAVLCVAALLVALVVVPSTSASPSAGFETRHTSTCGSLPSSTAAPSSVADANVPYATQPVHRGALVTYLTPAVATNAAVSSVATAAGVYAHYAAAATPQLLASYQLQEAAELSPLTTFFATASRTRGQPENLLLYA